MPKSDLAVGSNIHQHAGVRLGADAAGQQRRGDVRPHKSGHTAGQIYLRMGAGQAKLPSRKRFSKQAGSGERGMGKTVRVCLREQVQHRGVPCDDQRVHCFSGDMR